MSQTQCCPTVPVSWGELIDKITILQIKHDRIANREARANVDRELAFLTAAAQPAINRSAQAGLLQRLKAVNEELWEIEDAIRRREAEHDFGPRFVRLARAVYKTNDLRAAIKREINLLLGSELVEEKSYASTTASPPPRAVMPMPQRAIG